MSRVGVCKLEVLKLGCWRLSGVVPKLGRCNGFYFTHVGPESLRNPYRPILLLMGFQKGDKGPG